MRQRFIESQEYTLITNLPKGGGTFKESSADLAVRPSQIKAIYPLNYSLSSDRLTRNNTLYPLKSIIGNPNKEDPSGYKSFIMPLPVPVVKEHRLQDGGGMFGGGSEAEVPMGRVVFAGYKRKGKGDKQTKHTTLGYPGFLEGSGNLVTVPMITDPVAIELILSSRLLTTSISTEPEFVKCSICGINKYDASSECEHRKGQMYEDTEGNPALCYYEMGPLHACELSYVNAPSDTTSRNIDPDIGEAGLRLLIGDKPDGKSEFHFYDLLTQERVGMLDLESSCYAKNFNLLPSLASNPIYQINTEAIMSNKNKPFVEGVDHVEEELEETPEEVEETIEEDTEEEAKLDTKARKALPSGSFCGPNRSFPAPDKAHVIAGLRLLGRYKGPGSKASIKRCLLAKGKKYGVGSKETSEGIVYGIFPIQVTTPEGPITPWFIPCNDPESTEPNQACVEFIKEFLALGEFDYRENILIQIKRLAAEEKCLNFLVSEGLIDEDESVEGEFEAIKLQTNGSASDSYGWPFLTALFEHYQAQVELLKESRASEAKADETSALLESFVKLAEQHGLSLEVKTVNAESVDMFIEYSERMHAVLSQLMDRNAEESTLDDLLLEIETNLAQETESVQTETEDETTEEDTSKEEVDPANITPIDSPLVETEESNLSVVATASEKVSLDPYAIWNKK